MVIHTDGTATIANCVKTPAEIMAIDSKVDIEQLDTNKITEQLILINQQLPIYLGTLLQVDPGLNGTQQREQLIAQLNCAYDALAQLYPIDNDASELARGILAVAEHLAKKGGYRH